jgi:hypothetical protein
MSTRFAVGANGFAGLLGHEDLATESRPIVQRREAAEGERVGCGRLTDGDLGCHGGLLVWG